MKQVVTVKLSELQDAFLFVCAGEISESAAYISRETGKIHWCGDAVEGLEETPDDLDDESAYIAVPHKRDLDLGQRLIFRFMRERAPALYPSVQEIFGSKGAYRRFKDFLDRHNLLDQWYEFEEAQTIAALTEWCSDNGIAIDG